MVVALVPISSANPRGNPLPLFSNFILFFSFSPSLSLKRRSCWRWIPMRSTAVSHAKSSKKTSSEDRSRKRKTKSTKRRRDSSLEVSSYSSSEDEPRRSRRKSSRRENNRGLRSPSPKRKRRESRKPEKKKKSRKARHRRNLNSSSSESGSSWSCSTCRSRSVSRARSPVRADRKERGRGREREKGGKSSRKNRYRSPSCSTCSGGDSSRSSSSRSPIKGTKRKRENSRRSKLAFRDRESKERRRDEDKAKIIKAYGDLPSRSNDSRGVGRKKDTFEHCPEMKRTDEEVEHVRKDAHSDGVEEFTSSKIDEESVKHGDDGAKKPSGPVENSNSSKVDDAELVLRLKALENFNKYRVGLLASSKLGNKKAESGHTECMEDAGKIVETKLSSQAAVESKSVKPMELQRCEEGESQASEVRIKSVVSRPAEVRIKSVVNRPAQLSDALMSTEEKNDNVRIESKAVYNKLIASNCESLNSPNQLKSVNEFANTLSPEQSSLAKDDQAKRISGEPISSLAQEAEGNKADVSASCAPKTETGKHNPSENVMEATQFEQKTFSRMHDGEMVQVSYKVYIPKRTPALARRQLQR